MKKLKTTQSNPIDIHVGNRLRVRRGILGISQEKLGKLLGITFQQVQKYEKGVNRIGASRLFEISKFLKVSVDYFFDGFGKDDNLIGLAEDNDNYTAEDKKTSEETIQLLRAFHKISDSKTRQQAINLVKTLAETQDK